MWHMDDVSGDYPAEKKYIDFLQQERKVNELSNGVAYNDSFIHLIIFSKRCQYSIYTRDLYVPEDKNDI